MGRIIAWLGGLMVAGMCNAQPAVQVEFVFDSRVPSTKSLPSADLQATRRRLIAGDIVPTADLRALADFGDGLAAFHFARRLQAANPPARLGTAAHYYAIAAYTGRAFAVPPLANLLLREGAQYSPSLLEQALNAMTIQAQSGNAKAAQALGQMYLDGQPFGHNAAKAQEFLTMAGQSDAQAALDLGVLLMSDARDAAQGHVGAKAALALAAQGADLAAQVTAQNLLAQLNARFPDKKVAP